MHVVVIGSGIAGLLVAKKLGATLISDRKEFVFLPRLPDAVTSQVQYTKKITHDPHIRQNAVSVDREKKIVYTEKKSVPYDVLVVAIGAKPHIPIAQADGVHTLYTQEDVRTMRSWKKKSVIIVGGGPTGVELAAELSLTNSVRLIQGADTLVPFFAPNVQEYTKKTLERLGVELVFHSFVQKVVQNQVTTKTQTFHADEVVWCGGVRANTLQGLPVGKNGHTVDAYLRVDESVFVIGDCADTLFPKTAQFANRMALQTVANIRRMQKNVALKPFAHENKGYALRLGDTSVLQTPVGVITGNLATLMRKGYYASQLWSY